MKLAARQLGYWHAVPTGQKLTRGQEAASDDVQPDMPDLEGLDRLWLAWHDAGMTSGQEALRWSEVVAFGQVAGLSAQEQITLRGMSQAYLDGLALTNPLSIEPMEMRGERDL